MNRLERSVRQLDRLQQRRPWLALPFGVVRKYGDDNGARLAALLAYYGFFSLFPLLAVATTILGHVLSGDPALQARLLDTALRTVPLIGPRIGGNLHALQAGGLALAGAVVLSLWSGLGGVRAFQNAMDAVWNTPERRRSGFVRTNLLALAMLALVAALLAMSTAITALLVNLGGVIGGIAGWTVSLMVNGALFLVSFKVLCSVQVSWRTLVPGALAAGVAWTVLLAVGSLYVARQIAGANEVYGTFALVVGLLAWLYLGASVALYGAELNVVLAGRLWPRSIVQPPLTPADRSVLVRFAKQAERRPEVEVDVEQHPD